MAVYTGRRWVNPLNKKIGRRTGKDVRAGKNIRVDEDGFENFDDYFSESDAELTRDFTRHQSIKEESESAGTQDSEDECKENQSLQHNAVSQNMPNSVVSNTTCNNFQSSQTLSQGDASNRSKFGWLRNRNIGRRTGKNITANKQIRIDENGFENFDDYFSESDMSSVSSRLSVSVVKPYPRRGSIINSHHKDDGTQSLTSQESHETDELQSSESSQEDDGHTQSELQEQNNRTNNTGHSHHEGMYTSDEEKTFTPKTGQSSNLTHSSRSLSECDDLTYELEKEATKTENEANNTKQITRNQTFSHSHIDTPVSSRSSRSYSKVVSEGYSSSNISYTKSQDSKLDKKDSLRQTLMNDSDNNISQGEHKMNAEVNELKLKKDIAESDSYNNTSQRNGKTSQRNGKMSVSINNSIHKSQSKKDEKHQSNVSHKSISQGMPEISVQSNESTHKHESKSSENTEDSYNSDEDGDSESEMENDEDDAGEEHEDESDTKGEDLDEGEDAEDNDTENLDDQYSDNDLPEETDNIEHSDKESDEEMVEEESTAEAEVEKTTTELSKHEKVQSINRQEKGINKNHKSLDENGAQIHMTDESKCMSGKDSVNEEHKEDDDEEELRPSQAPSNIDVAGNKSGSITKLDIPTSVVSFNRTRKRLSYSASEASEKPVKRNKSRMEKANAELFDTDVSETSATKTTDNKTSFQTDTAENLNKVKSTKAEKEKLEKIKVAGEENNDFVCLTSRSTLAHTIEHGNNENVDDDDDDIVILDYNKTKHTSRVERKLSTNNKSRKQSKKSDSESHSDSGNQIQVKPLKKGSKSEIKVKKTKGGNKARRKTAHELNNVGDSIGQKDKTLGDDLIDNSIIDDNVVTDPHSDNDMHSVNDDEVIKYIRNETQNNDNKLKKGKKEVLNETNKSAVEKNSETKSRKIKKGKSQINSDEKIDEIDSKTSTLIETETNCDDDSVIQSRKRKSTKKKQSQVVSKNSEAKKQKYSKKTKSKRSASTDAIDVDINDTNDYENDYPNIDNSDEISPAQKIQNSSKNQRKDSKIEHINFEQENKKGSKRKSSSEDDVETQVKKTKTKKTKSDKKSRSKAKKNVSDDITISSNNNNDMVDYSKNITPTVDTRLSMPTNFGSGVSFRVSRRSELLEDVRSGYIGKINVEMEQTGGLTPCISRPGATRKSKGRRVTICPEENIEHSLNTGTPSLNSTPLPNFDSTPVHICETTNSATPCVDVESVIEDRLIKPSPSDEGLRRSQRTRLKPIEWYKNERVVFDYRRRSGPAIIGVKPSLEIKYKKLEEKKSKSKKLKYQIRKASQQGKDKPYRKLSIHREIPPDIDLADKSDPEITIYNQNIESEDGIACIGKHEAFKAVGPSHKTPKKEDPYLITKHLSHPCMSAGSLSIKPNAEKPEQLVTADYIVFFIDHGKVLVKIHNTTTLLESGDTFMVPIGNTYSISNLRNDTAKFFYTIHKQWENSDSGDNSDACDVNNGNGKSKRMSNGPDIC